MPSPTPVLKALYSAADASDAGCHHQQADTPATNHTQETAYRGCCIANQRCDVTRKGHTADPTNNYSMYVFSAHNRRYIKHVKHNDSTGSQLLPLTHNHPILGCPP